MNKPAYYVDSSALLGLILGDQSVVSRELLEEQQVVGSYLIEAEVFSACTRESYEIQMAVELLERITLISPVRSLRPEYNLIFQSGYLKGADAFHLACALFLDPTCKNLTFVTADKPQAVIAKKLGFKII